MKALIWVKYMYLKKSLIAHFVNHGMGLVAKTSNLIGAIFYFVHNIGRGVEVGDCGSVTCNTHF